MAVLETCSSCNGTGKMPNPNKIMALFNRKPWTCGSCGGRGNTVFIDDKKLAQMAEDKKTRMKWILEASTEEVYWKALEEKWSQESLDRVIKIKTVQMLEKIVTKGIYTQEKV